MSMTPGWTTEMQKQDRIMYLRSGDWADVKLLRPPGDELSVEIADVKHWGPEAEFFLFNDARYNLLANY